METKTGITSLPYSFLISALRRAVCVPRHSPYDLPPGQSPGIYFTCGWVDPRADLYGREKKIHFHPVSEPKPFQPVASSYIDYINPAATFMISLLSGNLAESLPDGSTVCCSEHGQHPVEWRAFIPETLKRSVHCLQVRKLLEFSHDIK
jgi:hypothetical protein